MAYDPKVPPSLLANGIGGARGLRQFAYRSTTDSVATVLGAGYITNARKLGMREGDSLRFVDPNNDTHYLQVGPISDAGAATLEFPGVAIEALPEIGYPDVPGTFFVGYDGGQQARFAGETVAAQFLEFSKASQAQAEAGVVNDKGMTPLRTRQAIDGRPLDAAFSGGAPYYVPDLMKQKISALDGMSLSQRSDVLSRGFTMDVTAAIQSAEDYLYSIDGGKLIFPSGLYKAAGLMKKFRVNWEGDSAHLLDETATVSRGSIVKAPAGNILPIIQNDLTTGTDRQIGLDGTMQKFALTNIYGMRFDANTANDDSRGLAALIRNAWSFGFERCSFIANKSGLAVQLLDCNCLFITGNMSFGGWFAESLADCYIGGGNDFGPGLSADQMRFMPCFWLAGASIASKDAHKNIFGENIYFNNGGNTEGVRYTPTVSAGLFTVAGGHKYNDGDPVVVVNEGGTLPSVVVEGQHYYVKRISSTEFRLAASRAALNAGTYIVPTGGSGNWYVQQGRATPLYALNSRLNNFAPSRSDQGYGPNLILEGSTQNTFVGWTILEAGKVYTAPPIANQPGVLLLNGSVDNTFPGSVITPGFGTTQDIGFKADLSSANNDWKSAKVSGHATADLQINGTNLSLGEPPMTLGSDRFEVTTGSPAIAAVGGGRRNAWAFDPTVREGIGTELVLPLDWRSFSIKLRWVNSNSNAGNVAWLAQIGMFAVGATINAADPFSSGVVFAAAAAQDILVETALSTGGFVNVPGRPVFLRIDRVANDAGDTLDASDVGLLMVLLEKVD